MFITLNEISITFHNHKIMDNISKMKSVNLILIPLAIQTHLLQKLLFQIINKIFEKYSYKTL